MNTYLVKFLGISYVGLPRKDRFQFRVSAWSEEEAREKVELRPHYVILSEIGVELLWEYSEQDHDELELRMEQGV